MWTYPGSFGLILTLDANVLVIRAGNWLPAIGRTVGSLLVAMVRAYQVAISPLLVGSCKFIPSCSQYYIMAVQEHGPWYGSWLGMRRVLRCHPFSTGGYDPVPPSAMGLNAPRGQVGEG